MRVFLVVLTVLAGACGQDNPCPGQLTCANMTCCPLGYPYECGSQCYSQPLASCAAGAETCTDDNGSGGSGAMCGDSSFSATITSASCGNKVNDPPFYDFTLMAAGSITGCGQDAIFFSDGVATTYNISCGMWSDNGNGGCVPSSLTTSSSTGWQMQQVEQISQGSSQVYTVSLQGGGVTLASMQVTCGP